MHNRAAVNMTSDHLPNAVPDDVRMRGFSRRSTVEEALRWLDMLSQPLGEQRVSLHSAAGRVLSHDVYSSVNVPGFHRGMMDGFAIQADDTAGASIYNRLSLQVVGEVLPGQIWSGELKSGQAVRIMTGAAMPAGADAVLPVEKVQIEDHVIFARDAVSPGKHVGMPGEDIAADSMVLPAGRRLRPQDVGLLSSIGCAEVAVVRKPRVRIVVTGNELLPPGTKPEKACIADSNSPMLTALIERDGGESICPGIVADDPTTVLEAMCENCDVVLVSGGSSVGQEDHAPTLLAEHGQLAIHGVAMRPSSPVGMGKLDDRLVLLLPGNPVSCLCAYDFFAGRAIRGLAGRNKEWPYRQKQMILKRKLVSVVGRVDYARVQIVDDQVVPLAISGASILSSTTRADGFVIIPADSEGYPPEEVVNVFLYDD